MHYMCLVRPVVLYLNVHVLKVFYKQTNYYYYYYYYFPGDLYGGGLSDVRNAWWLVKLSVGIFRNREFAGGILRGKSS